MWAHGWDLYNDDESFQRLARGRGFHDANLLAKVLYGDGKQGKYNKVEENCDINEKIVKDKKCSVQFRNEIGVFQLDAKLLNEDENENDFDFLWRTKDYSFQPVKDISDFVKNADNAVKTDVLIFDRKCSSEFDPEREDLKDTLLAWNARYKQRLEEKNKSNPRKQHWLQDYK